MGGRQARDVGRGGRIEDLGVVLVLLDDDEDVVIAGNAFQIGRSRDGADRGEGGGRRCSEGGGSPFRTSAHR